MRKQFFSVKIESLLTDGFHVSHQAFSQLAFTCSKLTIETLEQGVKYVQS